MNDEKDLEFFNDRVYGDYCDFPEGVQDDMGYALDTVQKGGMPPSAKTLSGFGSAKVIELIEHDEAGTYRAVCTVKYEDKVWVVDAFQKKSHQGGELPREIRERIERRLKELRDRYGY